MATHSRKVPADPNFKLRLELAMRRHKPPLRVTDLATRLGVTKGTVSHWLNGRFLPQPDMRPRLAGVLGVSQAWLMGDHIADEQQRERERRDLERILKAPPELDERLSEYEWEDLLRLLRANPPPAKTAPRKRY